MTKNELIAIAILFVGLYALLITTLIVFDKTIRRDNKINLKKIQELQDWTFKQLYEINPGILEPDAVVKEIVVESKKATVYNPNADPMAEFRGEKSDWHD